MTNCNDIQNGLQAWLEGSLPEGASQAVARHLAGCPRCREIEALMRIDLGSLARSCPEDLAASILERTVGSGCVHAGGMLCDRIDGLLSGTDEELLDLHLAHCPPCAALHAAIVRLADDLPALYSLWPGAEFTRDVLAATSGTTVTPVPAATASPGPTWTDRLSAAWERLLERPRLAWEAGYVGALALWLVFGGSTIPALALDALRVNPVASLEQTSKPLARTGAQAIEEGRRRGRESVKNIRDALATRSRQASVAVDDLKQHGTEFQLAVTRLDLPAGGTALGGMATDAGRIVRRFAASEPDDQRSEP